jgi:hypothetical protein
MQPRAVMDNFKRHEKWAGQVVSSLFR